VVEIGAPNPLCVHHDPKFELVLGLLRDSGRDRERRLSGGAKKRRVRKPKEYRQKQQGK
jgi:hypothetical protein